MPLETPRRYLTEDTKRSANDRKPTVKFDKKTMRIHWCPTAKPSSVPASSTARAPQRGILKNSSMNPASKLKDDSIEFIDDDENYVKVEWIRTGKTEILNLNELDPAIQAVGPASNTPDMAGSEIDPELPEKPSKDEERPAKVAEEALDFDASKDKVEQTRLLLEYYLSDKAALRDELLMKLARKASGWIPLNFLATYGKLKALTGSHTETGLLREAVESSDLLELSYDCSKVRRKIPFPDYDDTFASCTVVQIQEELPVSRSQILEIFKLFGQVRGIHILPRGLCVTCGLQKASENVCLNVQKFLSKNPELQDVHWVALVFVEFSTHREAETALLIMNRMSNKYGGRNLPVLPVKRRRGYAKEYPDEHELRSRSFQDYPHKLREHCCHPSGGETCAPQQFRRPTPCCCSVPVDTHRHDFIDFDPVKSHTEASKAHDEAVASDPAIIDCGLPMASKDGTPTRESVPDMRCLQIARQRVSWEPCLACEQVKNKIYAPIAHEFLLRLYPRRDVPTKEESVLDEAESSSPPEQSTPIVVKTLETSDMSTPSSGYGSDGCSSLEDSSSSEASPSIITTPLRASKILEPIEE